ncbi:Clavaminate synthase-like protein [Cryphonectria parasitica EP155]|uniref:Clavaminate synthase-like protein n=1 Tax=Cryphonectria parasitica (strain ATCC 38755 / EP155) TaxID=660469 RepID=A0A9P5CQ95_CRYP1|nr:Clavaminate synthase-like protein [Cryphonectria parasitica EP155]KAF3767284.1 Clavaminate synthase-like protein [Cryphonectria parasitica EP155]
MATTYMDRQIPKISLRDFDDRIDEITVEICTAAENVGFFSVIDHGLTPEEIKGIFATSESFFALPDEIKATVPWNPQNVGWEKNSQVRPSTGAADMKESYQLQFGENMLTGGKGSSGESSMWMSDRHLPGFREDCLRFMHRVQEVSNKLMVCLARGLGFPDDYFLQSHNPSDPTCQNVMRLLHYFATPEVNDGKIYHRAGAHADWGLLTLLFQQEGQTGLEICPGREAVTKFALGDTWTRVNIEPGAIICNIGDMLMSWSDDRFKSTFHRVKAPCEPGDYYGERFSIAFFNQPSKDTLIQGPKKKYPEITGRQFIANAMRNNFAANKSASAAQEKVAMHESSSAIPAGA